MTQQPYRVAIVVNPEFGESLAMLSETVHVWACDSPANRSVAQRHWGVRPNPGLEQGITLFKFLPTDPPDQVCLGILEMVDLHHGELSHIPPWNEVEVHGTSLTPALSNAFGGLGFSRFSSSRDGFMGYREHLRSG